MLLCSYILANTNSSNQTSFQMLKTILTMLALTTYLQVTLQRNPHRGQEFPQQSGQNQAIQNQDGPQSFRSSTNSYSPPSIRQSLHRKFGSQRDKKESGTRGSCKIQRYKGDLKGKRRAFIKRDLNARPVVNKQPIVGVTVNRQGSQKGIRITPEQILNKMSLENRQKGLKQLGLNRAISMTSLTASLERDKKTSLERYKKASLDRGNKASLERGKNAIEDGNEKGKERSNSWNSLKRIGEIQFVTGKVNPKDGLQEVKSKLLGASNPKDKNKDKNRDKNKDKSKDKAKDKSKNKARDKARDKQRQDSLQSDKIKKQYEGKMQELNHILLGVVMGIRWNKRQTVLECQRGKELVSQLRQLASAMVAKKKEGAVFKMDPEEWIVTCDQAERTLTEKQELAMNKLTEKQLLAITKLTEKQELAMRS